MASLIKVIVSKFISLLAIIAVNEISHGFISPFNLNLNKSSPITSTIITLEHSLEISLLFYLLFIPISSFVPHSNLLSILSLSFLL